MADLVSVLIAANVTRQRPRATGGRNGTDGSSRGSLHALCWAARFSFGWPFWASLLHYFLGIGLTFFHYFFPLAFRVKQPGSLLPRKARPPKGNLQRIHPNDLDRRRVFTCDEFIVLDQSPCLIKHQHSPRGLT